MSKVPEVVAKDFVQCAVRPVRLKRRKSIKTLSSV